MKLISLFAALVFPMLAAEPVPGDRVVATFSDPSRPGVVRVSLLNGSIFVKGYSGKEVIVETHTRDGKPTPPRTDGLRRVPMSSTGLNLEEENNVMRISTVRGGDLDIQVPVTTTLKLHSINNGSVRIENVQGETEVDCLNGAVTLTGISGSVVAHSLNGGITATFVQVDPRKPMSFSSMNGKIDVTLPSSMKANVKVKSNHGDVFSDFDIKIEAGPGPQVEDSRSQKGKYRVRIDRTFYGTINGGGPEIQFTNFNGPIFIRKGQ